MFDKKVLFLKFQFILRRWVYYVSITIITIVLYQFHSFNIPSFGTLFASKLRRNLYENNSSNEWTPFTVEQLLDVESEIPNLPFVSEYATIYKENISKPRHQSRFVIFKYTSRGFGWGNRVTSMMSVFLFALATRRIFVIDHTLFDKAFDPPTINNSTMIQWQFDVHRDAIVAGNTRNTAVFKGDHMFNGSDLNEIFTEQTIAFETGHGYFVNMLNNPRYHPLFTKLFPQSISQNVNSNDTLHVELAIARFLIGRPTNELRQAAILRMKKINIQLDRPLFTVQYRTFFDAPNLQITSLKNQYKFWNCMHTLFEDKQIKKWMQSEAASGRNVTIFYTTDERKTHPRAMEELSRYGHIIIDSEPIVHSSISGDKLATSILHWFIMGLSSGTMSTGTSFAITSVYRTGAMGVYRDIRYIHEENSSKDIAGICEDKIPSI